MDFYSAKLAASKFLAAFPAQVPEGHLDPGAYLLSLEDNLAFALCERRDQLTASGMDEREAGVTASQEVADLAQTISAPTPEQISEARAQLDQMAAEQAKEATDEPAEQA